MSWIDIGALADIPERGARVVDTPAGRIAVFRLANGDIHAIADRCPHKGGPLSEGLVHGCAVACSLHNRVFRLDTGAAQDPEDAGVPLFPTRLEGDRILLDPVPALSLPKTSTNPPMKRGG
jgi:nitrite reductase (NADH) small subunit